MNNNLQNWSMYMNFLSTFQHLKYRKVPLALLCHFLPYIKTHSFPDNLHQPTISKNKIQPWYNQLFEKNTVQRKKSRKTEKIVLYDNNLRFARESYTRFFHEYNSVILRNRNDIRPPAKTAQIDLNLPIHFLDECIPRADLGYVISQYQSKALDIFNQITKAPFKINHLLTSTKFKTSFIHHEIPRMIKDIEAVYTFFEHTPTSCIILGDTAAVDKPSRILPIVAQLRGIPSICIQHAIIGADRGWLPIISTKHIAYGEPEVDYFKSFGVTMDQLEIMGHPRFDNISLGLHMEKETFYSKLKIDTSKKTVLFCTQPITLATEIETIIQSLPTAEYQAIIKTHYQEKESEGKKYGKILQKYPFVRLISSEYNLYDIITNVDCVVVKFSTTGLESLLCGKPVIFMNKSAYGGAPYKYCEELTEPIPSRVGSLIHRVLSDHSFQNLATAAREEYLIKSYPIRDSGIKLCEMINQLTNRRYFNV